MLRKNKNVVIYQGGRAIGGAGTHAFKREEARGFLAGRTQARPAAASGTAETAQIDAPGEQADAVARKARHSDIRFNTNSRRVGQWRDAW
jgi:hypothetical protein